MGATRFWHRIIVAGLVTLPFGRNRVSGLMADIGNGIRDFRSGGSQ
ncbi:twin-arginine translocase TatA/TatE family subunit [Bradyrhizobium sp. Gha]|nr:twin-arginine translocase TatA/TatE family subunit [Bradyrhizobium sp. Gha]SFJ70656.1 hypothetical protein SAMN05216525_13286 [Bradyrhizobium sp. Gha]